jgi:hypothetical protein
MVSFRPASATKMWGDIAKTLDIPALSELPAPAGSRRRRARMLFAIHAGPLPAIARQARITFFRRTERHGQDHRD